MELVAFDVHGGKLLVGALDPFLVVAGVQARVDLQAGAGRGRADQVDDHLQALKRPSASVEADVAEHAMLGFVPLRRPGRKVADADRQRELAWRVSAARSSTGACGWSCCRRPQQ